MFLNSIFSRLPPALRRRLLKCKRRRRRLQACSSDSQVSLLSHRSRFVSVYRSSTSLAHMPLLFALLRRVSLLSPPPVPLYSSCFLYSRHITSSPPPPSTIPIASNPPVGKFSQQKNLNLYTLSLFMRSTDREYSESIQRGIVKYQLNPNLKNDKIIMYTVKENIQIIT